MIRFKNYLKYIIMIVVLIILGLFLFLFYYNKADNKNIKNKENIVLEKKNVIKEEKIKEKEEVKYVYVDVKGAVNKPGVYKLEEGNRVIDAINASSGLRSDADTSIINLSKKLTDEMLIIIYTKDQIDNYKNEITISKINEVINKNKIVLNKENNAEINSVETKKEEEIKNEIININTASKDQILSLPGIGESKADTIIKYREDNGNFNSIEDIKNVSGIGESLFEKIKDHITV